MEVLDGTLKLRHCTEVFTMGCPLGLYPGLVMGMVKKQSVTPGHLLYEGSDTGKRVRLTRKTRPGVSSHDISDPVHPTPRRWKRLRPPSSEQEWGVRWACLAIFFLDLGLVFVGTP